MRKGGTLLLPQIRTNEEESDAFVGKKRGKKIRDLFAPCEPSKVHHLPQGRRGEQRNDKDPYPKVNKKRENLRQE